MDIYKKEEKTAFTILWCFNCDKKIKQGYQYFRLWTNNTKPIIDVCLNCSDKFNLTVTKD